MPIKLAASLKARRDKKEARGPCVTRRQEKRAKSAPTRDDCADHRGRSRGCCAKTSKGRLILCVVMLNIC